MLKNGGRKLVELPLLLGSSNKCRLRGLEVLDEERLQLIRPKLKEVKTQ